MKEHMELFTEIYNCYYQIVDEILKIASERPITEKEMLHLATRFGYEESGLTIVPKLKEGNWNLLDKTEEGYISKVDNLEVIPLTILQKRWLKSILLDEKTYLFLDREQISILQKYLDDVDPLYEPDDFYYYDRFQNGDDFSSKEYISHFRTLLEAIREKKYVDIHFTSKRDEDIHHYYLPCRIEYSAKNDKFRLLALYEKNNTKQRVENINLSRIASVQILDKTYDGEFDLKASIKASYYKEPVKLLITNKRNTLERAMLHFANYEKHTTKLDDEHYECLIYYNQGMETELLIEILSFGPTIKVLEPDDFVYKIEQRIEKQISYT